MTVKIATKAQQGASVQSAIGQSTWTGALLLARALCAEAPKYGDIDDCSSPHTAVAVDADWSVVGRTCLELGCGTGLAGLAALSLECQRCTFSDCSLAALHDLRESLSLLPAKLQGGASIRRHVWETDSPENFGKPLRHWSNADACNDPTFCPCSLADDDVYDCIIAADVLYFEVQVEPLVHTLNRRLKDGGFALILVTVRTRTTATVRRFEAALSSAGFQVASIPCEILAGDMSHLSQAHVAAQVPVQMAGSCMYGRALLTENKL